MTRPGYPLHQWQADIILYRGPAMICTRCEKIWWPHQFEPKGCPGRPRRNREFR